MDEYVCLVPQQTTFTKELMCEWLVSQLKAKYKIPISGDISSSQEFT